ncbi:MAG: PCMD domain-containing protein [Cryomorphaceae bacterium]|jgi:hypothetical protein|nr:PCMD domain-containing protein [Cryomorphaceae bacterium]
MKKMLLIFPFVGYLSLTFAQTQIGNSDFEQWETSTSELAEPVNWNSFKSGSGTWSSFGGQQLDQSTTVRPGSSGTYAARIFSRDAGFGIIANGNMTLGRIEMGSTTPNSLSNYNYSVTSDGNFSEAFTGSPDSLVVWVKYTPVNATGNNARVSAVIHNNTNNYKDPNDVSGSNTVATAILNFPSNGAVWQRLAIPFSYVGTPTDAAFIMVTFTTNSTPGGGSVNDELLIDDLELIYNPTSGAGLNETSENQFSLSYQDNGLNLFGVFSDEATYRIYSTSGSIVQKGKIAEHIPFNNSNGVYYFQLVEGVKLSNLKFLKN